MIRCNTAAAASMRLGDRSCRAADAPRQPVVGARPGEGERRLIIAVLEDAISCFQRFRLATRPSVRRLYEESEEWILSTENGPFSFVYICHVLGIDADWLRASLLTREAERYASARVGALTEWSDGPAERGGPWSASTDAHTPTAGRRVAEGSVGGGGRRAASRH